MDSNNLVQLLQKSFHVTLGATAALVEVLQDPQKREQNLSKLKLELDELAQEWSERGEMTEVEARNFVSSLLESGNQGDIQPDSGSLSSSTTTVADPIVQLKLQELTAQLAAIRAELERLRNEPTP